jgi:flavorubredoxin
MFPRRHVAADTEILPAFMPVPAMGVLPVNAFVIHAAQPVLIDAGLPALAEEFVATLAEAIDPADLRWIWITHMDADHVGALERLLALAPQAKIATNFLGFGKLGMRLPVAPERVHLINPGQTLDVGDRKLVALEPPTYDAPETLGLFDTRSHALFSSDSFGAVLDRPAETTAEIDPDELRRGMTTWASVDAPWIHEVTRHVLAQRLDRLPLSAASVVLSSHLPPSREIPDRLRSNVERARTEQPFVGPDQEQLRQIMAAV